MGAARSNGSESAGGRGQQWVAHWAREAKRGPRQAPSPASAQSQGAAPLEGKIPKRCVLRRDLSGFEDGVWPEAESGHGCIHRGGGIDVVRLANERCPLGACKSAERPRAA